MDGDPRRERERTVADPVGDTLTRRAGLAALALGVSYAASRTSLADGGVWGRLLIRLDLAGPVLLALAGAWLHRRAATTRRAPSADHHPESGHPRWTSAVRRAAAIWAWYVVGLVVALAVTRPGFGARQTVGAFLTLPPWRATEIPGYGQGWLIGTVLLFALVEPLAARAWRALDGPATRRRWLVLAAIGVLFRVILIVLDRPLAAGPLERLPGQLPFLALGAAAVSLAGHRSSRSPWAARAALAGPWVIAAALPISLSAPVSGRGWELVRLGLALVVAAAATHGLGRSTLTPGRWSARPWLAPASVVLVGSLLVYQAATESILRQYVERRVAAPFGFAVIGPWFPPLAWSLTVALLAAAALIGAATAVLGSGAVTGRSLRRAAGSWRWSGLAGVTAGAGLLRYVALLTVAPPKPDGGDPLFYHTTANLLAEGRGFIEPLNWIAYGRSIPSALHGPAYPVYLAAFSRLGARTIFDHRMASIVAGTALVALCGVIAHRLAGPRAGVLAAALAGLYPTLWVIDGVLFPEGVFALCTTLVVWYSYRWLQLHRTRDLVWAGVWIGIAAMVRGEGLFLSAVLIAPMVLRERALPWRRRVLVLSFAALAVVGTLAPWTIRNSVRFDAFVSLSANGDELHVYSNCADTYSGKYLGFWLFDCQERIRQVEGEAPGDEAERAKYWRDVGWTYAREHASELPKVVAARVGRQWELFRPLQNVEFAPIEGRDKRVALAGLLSYYALVPFAVFGLVRLRRRGRPTLPLVAQFVSVTITAAYAYGTVRFRAPAEAALVILAGIGLVPLAGRASRWWAERERSQPLHDPDAFVLGGSPASWRGATRSPLAIVAVAAMLLAPLRGLLRTPGAPMEEGFMLTFPERVLKGDVPNVDFLHLYGPGSLDALALTYANFGVRIGVERMFGFLQLAALVFGLYTLMRPWGRLLAAGSAMLAVTLIVTPVGLDALAWPGALALGVWSIVAALRATSGAAPRRRAAFVSGALAGLALTFRPDLVVALALALFGVLRTAPRPDPADPTDLAKPAEPRHRRWRPFVVGAILGLIPMWVHLVLAGPVAAIEGMLLDPVFRLRGGRTLPRPPSWTHFDGALQVIAEKFPPWWGVPHLAGPHQLVLWFWLMPVFALVVLAVAWWGRRLASPASRVLLAGGLFALGIVQQGFQRPDSAHFAWVTCISVPLLAPAAAEVVGRFRPRWSPYRRGVTILAGLLGLYLLVMPFFTLRSYLLHVRQTVGSLPPGLEIERNGRAFYLGDVPPWLASQQLIADLDARLTPGERLLVGPVDLRHTVYSDAVFYYLFPELEPATKYIEMDPGMANAEDSGLAEDVASADWLILTRFWAGWIEPNESSVFGPDAPNQVVEEQFCLVGSYEHDIARLYRKCEGGGAPGPYEGPYDPAFDYAVEVRVAVPRRPDGTCTPTCVD
ncbi:MAG: glycosyltransferase family 39 protein [Ilumatobacteraceae bacterium]